ncbi:hypothetical protein [Aliivibrio fischeri]|uniref:hypothetical protein n=1 Tax=Aliivibrio fischeri TaxID=668 RepID=UPI00105D78B8|nr:hypothetical protein [Aliivibrio fischeri]TDM51380.1 hypothetical protein VFFQA001_14730 [Aliivibrio fischeri]
MKSFIKKISLKFIAFVVFVATVLPLYQEFVKEPEPIIQNITTVVKESVDDLEIREPSFDIILQNANKYIFVVPGSLSVLKLIAFNKSEFELKSCKIIYQFKYDDFNHGRFYYKRKAIPANSYKTLTEHEKFDLMAGDYPFSRPKEFYSFNIKANSDVEIISVTERFGAPPDALRFYVQCDKRISNKLTIYKSEVSLIDRSWFFPDWYYEVSKFFVAPYM